MPRTLGQLADDLVDDFHEQLSHAGRRVRLRIELKENQGQLIQSLDEKATPVETLKW